MIELSEMISELRRELNQAIDAGAGERLRFELGPVEVEVTVGLDSKGTAGAKGATISATASDGRSHAGQHGHNGHGGGSSGSTSASWPS